MVDINLIPREYRERRERFKTIFSKAGIAVFALVILSLLFYGGLLLYKNNLNKNLERINQELLLLEQKRNPANEKAMIELDKRLNLLKTLFENHVYWSQLFQKVEELTIPEVYFSEAKFILSKEVIDFTSTGATLTYTDLARQILTFQLDPSITSVKVSGISLDEKMGIKFNLLINFSKNILLAESND